MAHPEGIFPLLNMGCGFTGCPQYSPSWGIAPHRAPGLTMEGLPPKLLKAPKTAYSVSSEFWVPALCGQPMQAAEAVSHQAASGPQRSVCLIYRNTRKSSKLLRPNNPASCLCFPSPWGGSCFLQFSLRNLRVPFLPFQSANTNVSNCLY